MKFILTLICFIFEANWGYCTLRSEHLRKPSKDMKSVHCIIRPSDTTVWDIAIVSEHFECIARTQKQCEAVVGFKF